jgi:peptide/nickel transport system substrate-binding protein
MYSHGTTGGSAADYLDPHSPVTVPDIARVNNLYEPLLQRDPNFKIQPHLAESLESSKDAVTWTLRLRKDVAFHNGKTMKAEDIIATFERILDPKAPTSGGFELSMVDPKQIKAVDPYTVRFTLKSPYALLEELLAAYTLAVIPKDFDLAHPVGTGAFKYKTFTPGVQSTFVRFDDYWDTPAWVDELIIYDFPDEAAKVDALLSGQVQSVDNLPASLLKALKGTGTHALISETGAWTPITMRLDAAPFKDVRVRQAMRLICDRPQMIEQALNGQGRIGNDLYSPFDPAYNHDLPQRHRDIDQAKSLLKAAGQSDLRVELATSTAVGTGGVESANLFAEQARAAGVRVRVSKKDSATFYGDNYLSWPFAQDFWNTRQYIPQVAQCAVKGAPYNECHFYDKTFAKLVKDASKELDKAKRDDMLKQAQKIEYDTGGYIIWGFKNQVDAYSNRVRGLVPDKYLPMSGFQFKRASLD